MKKAVIYARYSSERQTEQSIEGQLSVCNKFAQDNGFVVVETYIDRATTGTNDNRPEFRRMLHDSANREWEYVLIYKGDRFARNRIESAINKKTLKDNGVKLISCTENIPDTPEGIILESLLEGMAEYYSAELAQKVRRGMNESRKKGQTTGGYYLYGYDVVDKKYVVNEAEAEIVRKIFEDYANGRIVKDIIAELSALGLKNKYGKPFAKNTVYRMLRMEKYTGIVRYGDEVYEDIIPRIVPQETWEIVQKINESNKQAPSKRKAKEKYLLSGKLVCGECGGLMTGEAGTSRNGDVHYYYKCFEKKKHTKPCSMPSVKKDDIENKVFRICCDVLSGGFIPQVVEEAYKIRQEEIEANATLISLKHSLAEKEKALDNFVRAIEQGIFNSTTNRRMEELEADISIIKSKITCEEEKQNAFVTKDEYRAFLESFVREQTGNDSFKQEVIDLLIRKVVLFRDKIRVTFNFSPDKGGRKDRDLPLTEEELREIEDEFADLENGGKCSNLVPLGQPNTWAKPTRKPSESI